MSRGDREADAVVMLRGCREALAARGSTVLHEAAGMASGDIADWQHYPAGESYDPLTHLQYFFHRHAAAAGSSPDERAESGHFHVFLRGEGMPPGVAPLVLAETAVANAPSAQSAPLKRGGRDEVCHLVAIAVDGHGEPIRLFTTNRWVTGETWYRADDVIAMLGRVRVGPGQASLLDRWIVAAVRSFTPEIAVLLRRRDKAINEWRWRWSRGNAFEDPRLEITSSCDIDVGARLAAAEARAAAPPPAHGGARRTPLPSMAEGWGS